jgi:hypothetical protein
MGYNFNLEQNEAELLINALQNQTNGLINKIQGQFAEQTKPLEKAEDEDEILVEENDGAKGN